MEHLQGQGVMDVINVWLNVLNFYITNCFSHPKILGQFLWLWKEDFGVGRRGVGRLPRNMWRPRPVDSIIIGAAGGRVNIFIHFQPIFGPTQPEHLKIPFRPNFELGRKVEVVFAIFQLLASNTDFYFSAMSAMFAVSFLGTHLSALPSKNDFTSPAAM